MARQGFLKRMSAALFAAAELLMIGSALLGACPLCHCRYGVKSCGLTEDDGIQWG